MKIKVLPEIIFDKRARDGTWCQLPYPRHPKGCPNFPKCIHDRQLDFFTFNKRIWYAIIVQFDLEKHATLMKIKHPNWTEIQCRNLLWWQSKVRSELNRSIARIRNEFDLVLDIPEAYGINVFSTMEKVGVFLEKQPKIVHKTMFIGKLK